MTAVQEQKLLLGRAILEKIDEPLQRPAVDRRLIAVEVLGSKENLPVGVLQGVADVVNDQPAVGLDLARNFATPCSRSTALGSLKTCNWSAGVR